MNGLNTIFELRTYLLRPKDIFFQQLIITSLAIDISRKEVTGNTLTGNREK